IYDKVNGKWNGTLFPSRPGSQSGGAPYYLSSGTLNYIQMSDSNLNTCEVKQLVRFTNLSIKYRLNKALDDDPVGNYYPYYISPDKLRNYPNMGSTSTASP